MALIESERIIAKFDKSYYEEVRLLIVGISGREYISLGIFMKDTGKFVRGITVAPQVAAKLLPEIQKAIDEIRNGAGQ